MQVSEESWLSVVDAFSDAPLTGNWIHALSLLGDATGSRSGELIGLGSENTVPFNWASDLDESYSDSFIEMGGGDPAENPFVRAGLQAPVLKALSSEDFLTRQERRRNCFVTEQTRLYDVSYVCLTNLIKEPDKLVGLAVLRSRSQGEITDSQREIFASIAPHVRAAVRMQMSLEHQGAALVAGTLEALSLAVFVCDRRGRVKSMTPDAEALLNNSSHLTLKNGLLSSARGPETRSLKDAITAAAAGITGFGEPVATTLVMGDPAASPIVLDILPVPRRDFVFGFEPRVLVVVKGTKSDADQVKTLLARLYQLTAAEAEVAMGLVDGETPEHISAARGSSVGTVRAQIRTIYSKCGINRCSELIAKVNQLR